MDGVEKSEALALNIAHGWCLYYLILSSGVMHAGDSKQHAQKFKPHLINFHWSVLSITDLNQKYV